MEPILDDDFQKVKELLTKTKRIKIYIVVIAVQSVGILILTLYSFLQHAEAEKTFILSVHQREAEEKNMADCANRIIELEKACK